MEALSFFHYLSREKLITYEEVELELVFVERELPKLNELKMNDEEERVDAEEENEKVSVTEETTLTVTVPQAEYILCLLYTSPSPRDGLLSRMPSSA